MGRSRSSSSSSSSSSDSDKSGKHKDHKDKHGKDKHDKHDKHSGGGNVGGMHIPPMGAMAAGMPLMPHFGQTPFATGDHRGITGGHEPAHSPQGHPPPYAGGPQVQAPPPSGFRTPLTTDAPFPYQGSGPAPCYDADGRSPVFFGSALFPKAVHPCKVAPHLSPACRVPYGGSEYEHHGRYDLLPFNPETMELVMTSNGQIPHGRRPVEGGYEETGHKLYHAVADINGIKVPGKAGEHLYGCNVPFGNAEHVVTDHYQLLCWRH